MKHRSTLTVLFTTSLLTPAYSAGFQLAERSAAGLGRAFSGESVIADDASILGSNPAGMSLLSDTSFAFGANVILPSIDVSGNAPNFLPGGGGAPAAASDRNIVSDAIVPYGYVAKKINDKISVGIGVYTTYGLKSDYSSGFSNLAATDFSEVLSFNINPAISYRINRQWSVGAGFDALYAEGTLTSSFINLPTAVRPEGPLPGTDINGDDWGYGYNLGILFEVNDSTRFGLHYRSSIFLNIEGSVDFNSPLGTTRVDAELDVQLPDTLEFSAYHKLNSKWAIHGDVLWTQWSKFQQLDVQSTPDIPAVIQNWQDAYRYSIGATYQHNDKLTLRTGIAYDESPVSTENRTLRIPDADRIWISAGFTYKINESYNFDFGYTHIFGNDADILRESNGGNEDFFEGEVSGDVDIISVGISGQF